MLGNERRESSWASGVGVEGQSSSSGRSRFRASSRLDSTPLDRLPTPTHPLTHGLTPVPALQLVRAWLLLRMRLVGTPSSEGARSGRRLATGLVELINRVRVGRAGERVATDCV